jgi:hypothetical protein
MGSDQNQDSENQPFMGGPENSIKGYCSECGHLNRNRETTSVTSIAIHVVLCTITAVVATVIAAQRYSKPCSDPSLQLYCQFCRIWKS